MLLQKILSNIVLALSASATVLPVTNELSGPADLSPERKHFRCTQLVQQT